MGGLVLGLVFDSIWIGGAMTKIFEELVRRNIFKVAIAYILVGWLIVQVVADMIATYSANPAILPFIIVMLIAGLPGILLVSWAYEITPEGMMKTGEVDAEHSITHKTGKTIDKIIIAAFVMALAYYFWPVV